MSTVGLVQTASTGYAQKSQRAKNLPAPVAIANGKDVASVVPMATAAKPVTIPIPTTLQVSAIHAFPSFETIVCKRY